MVLPVDMKHGEINKELGLPSDYTTTVEDLLSRHWNSERGTEQSGLLRIVDVCVAHALHAIFFDDRSLEGLVTLVALGF